MRQEKPKQKPKDASPIGPPKTKIDKRSGGVYIGDNAQADIQGDVIGRDQNIINLPPLTWKTIAIGLTIPLILAASIWGIYQAKKEKIYPPMTGDVRIAFASIGVLDPVRGQVVSSKDGMAFAQDIYTELNPELDALSKEMDIHIEHRGPAEIPGFRDSTPEALPIEAEAIAARIEADVVVYGYLEITPTQTKYLPEFYISDRLLRQAEELANTGQYKVESVNTVSDDITRNPAARSALKKALFGGPQSLSYFIMGLGDFLLRKYDDAALAFQKAQAANQGKDPNIQKIYTLFIAKTAHETQKWDLAMQYYQEALAIDPDFARAQLGYADTIFQKARGDCKPGTQGQPGGTDPKGLTTAISEYEKARNLKNKPPAAYIDTKIAFYLGRAYLCQGLAGDDSRWVNAEGETVKVIQDVLHVEAQIPTAAAGSKDSPPVQNALLSGLASEAYANLGLIDWLRPAADPATEKENLQAAIANYGSAIKRARWPDRQALFHSMRAQLYEITQDYQKADEEWNFALELDPTSAPDYQKSREKALPKRTPSSNSPASTPK